MYILLVINYVGTFLLLKLLVVLLCLYEALSKVPLIYSAGCESVVGEPSCRVCHCGCVCDTIYYNNY